MRALVNTAYAYLAEQCDAADRTAQPAYLVAGVDGDELDNMSRRNAFDSWLSGPIGKAADDEAALLRFLGG